MKLCQTCGQHLAEAMTICPSCGDDVELGRQSIDDFKILDIIREGHASVLCKAQQEGSDKPVFIRIFKEQTDFDDEVAERLQVRKQQLDKLSADGFVKHLEIKKSRDGTWYRISEWIEGEDWSRIFASGILNDHKVIFDLFYNLAKSLTALHESGHFIPHLVLNDIIVIRENGHKLRAKIDYKLSRFLENDPHIPGTMLNDLLQCHPDMVNNKPLDFRSDIWSLGRVFLQLLTGDLSGCPPISSISLLKIPKNAKTLLKIMLSEDPSLRPQSMKEVADYLLKIKKQKTDKLKKVKSIKKGPYSLKKQRIKPRPWSLVALLGVVMLATFAGLSYFGVIDQDVESKFRDYANRYSNSVAFVLVEYTLVQDDVVFYRRRTEGTAFLVDDEGFLITNRHVAAPWLLDRELFIMIEQLRRQKFEVKFDYKMFLWFEGEKAYKRIPGLEDSTKLNDIYHIESAFRNDRKPRVEIAGIERSVVRRGYISRSPLKDDFAVLKIDPVPEGLEPIPLDESMDIRNIKKLSPLITIGFPLGSRTQNNKVNVSVTKGNVRRAFEDMIQVDTSIYKGNSGGPIIDVNGNAIGIATGIIFDTTAGMVPVITPLSDIGMVLPITKTVKFLSELKSGQSKWNGVLDISVDEKVEKIKNVAMEGLWQKALKMSDDALRYSLEPDIFKAAGMIHFCNGDHRGARQFFDQALSMDPEDFEIRMMNYLIDWLNGAHLESKHRKPLLALDWRSKGEFFGYLTRILEEEVPLDAASIGWHSAEELGWISYVTSLLHYKNRQREKADTLLKNTAEKVGAESWVLFLILAEINKMHEQQQLLTRGKLQKDRLERQIKRFNTALIDSQSIRVKRLQDITPLYSRLLSPNLNVEDKILILNRMVEMDPENKETLVTLSFFSAMAGNWQEAHSHISDLLKKGVRENKSTMSVLILELGVMKKLGIEKDEVDKRTELIISLIDDPWYKDIIKTLAAGKAELILTDSAIQNPEYSLSAHFALGFWAESLGNNNKAINHYKEALGTHLEGWWEYEFAKMRIRKLRASIAEKAASG